MYLNTHTYYSYRYGTISPQDLLEMARERGIKAMALTDINNASAALNYARLAPQYGIEPVLGIDFRNGVRQCFVGIAGNNEGFEELNRFLSRHLHEGRAIPATAPPFANAFVIYPFAGSPPARLRDNEYVGLRPADLRRLPFTRWTAHMDRLVILQTVSFRTRTDFNIHRLLRAIDNNTLLSKLSREEEGEAEDIMLTPDELRQIYAAYPAIIRNTEELLERCGVQFDFGDEHPHKNQQTYTGSLREDVSLIRELCREGLEYRYGTEPSDEILNRMEKELDIIVQKGFLSYFLINWDIVRYARSKGYFYVGRGSGANSIIAYLLRITDVDPIDLDLYFERFINLYRKNPPDFDIDFSWRDRDDVTRYIFERFRHTALLATYNTFQYRAVVRELGKVFGLPKHEIDELSAGHTSYRKLDHINRLVLHYGSLIQDFPSHLSIHAGGILISEKPIACYSPTFLPPKGYPTTQFDMIVAEDIGLYKFDILSQRGLGKIKDTLEVIRENRPEEQPPDIHDIPRFKKDPGIRKILREGNAIGCFYVESPAMRMLLKKLRVDNYLGLVAASSIIRPGVAKSGMMREYILRYRHPERRKEAHPVLMNIMPDTYGVMVYQEDVIKVAHYFAGLTLAEADVLRRGMSGKFRSREEFSKVRQKFFDNCVRKGYSPEVTAEIWRQIESFAGYAFSKGHSASYAVESYQSLFLKAHYPLEYMVSVINNFGGFYRTELYVHEARMHGACIEAPCVNRGRAVTTIRGTVIYIGMGFIADLDERSIEELLLSRARDGLFRDLADFVKRVGLPLEQLSLLIRAGAFRFTGKSRKALLWEAHMYSAGRNSRPAMREIFRTETREFHLPPLNQEPLEEAFDQIELLGFPLCHPFLLSADPLSIWKASDMPAFNGQVITLAGYLVAVKQTSTGNGMKMNFGTFLDADGCFIDTVHFPPVAAAHPFRGKGIYHITGRVVEEFGFYSLEVKSMAKVAMIEDPRFAEENKFGKKAKENAHPTPKFKVYA